MGGWASGRVADHRGLFVRQEGALDSFKNKTLPIHIHHRSTDKRGEAENNKQMILFPLLAAAC